MPDLGERFVEQAEQEADVLMRIHEEIAIGNAAVRGQGQSDSFAIVGYEHSMSARAGIGSLLLAGKSGGKLVYVGSVGTGFKEAATWKLREELDKLATKKPAIEYAGKRKNIVWTRPRLIAEIEYRAWTGDWKLRHASYKGLRDDQDNSDVLIVPDSHAD